VGRNAGPVLSGFPPSVENSDWSGLPTEVGSSLVRNEMAPLHWHRYEKKFKWMYSEEFSPVVPVWEGVCGIHIPNAFEQTPISTLHPKNPTGRQTFLVRTPRGLDLQQITTPRTQSRQDHQASVDVS
jgi:hypothetical protein